ncbi:MAG TPA: hypothetical protein VMB50_03725 [Myxococcales bacterium]|nr:hypothetical protein [Myxococcales bacterium]
MNAMRLLPSTLASLALVLGPCLALAQEDSTPGPQLPANAPPRPTQAPPPPPAEIPPPPEQPTPPDAPVQDVDNDADDGDDAAPLVAPPGAGTVGQWVYTAQFGWLWAPSGDEFSEIPDYGMPYSYVYCSAYGWTWIVSPWYSGARWPYRYFWAGSYHPAGYTFRWSHSVYATYGGGSDYHGWSSYHGSSDGRASEVSTMRLGGAGWSYSDGRPGDRHGGGGTFSTYSDPTPMSVATGHRERGADEAGSARGPSIGGTEAAGGGWSGRGDRSWRDGRVDRVESAGDRSIRRGGEMHGTSHPAPVRYHSEGGTTRTTSSHMGGGGASRGGKR